MSISEKTTVIKSSSSGHDENDLLYKPSFGTRSSNIMSRSMASPLRHSTGGGSTLVRTVEYGYGSSMPGMGPGGYGNVSNSGVTSVKTGREREKKDMQDLNERFASYIEKVRFLEAQNRKLGNELDELRSKWGKETSNVKQMYEAEMTEARKLIDDLSKDKAALEIKLSSIQEQFSNLQAQLEEAKKYRQQDREQINKLNQQLADYDSEIHMLRRSVESLETERARDKTTINRLQQEVDNLRMDLNNETLAHLDAENRRQTLEEEMEFMKKVHEQELKELAALAYRDTTAENREFWKSELSQAIRDIQQEYDAKVDQLRGDMEGFYNLKIQEYRTGATKQNMEVTHIREENKKLTKMMSDLRGKLADMEARNAQLEKQYQELVREFDSKDNDHMMECAQLTEEISKLRAEMEGILTELQTLMDAKLSLELEIAAYRKLLEGEESRVDWRTRASLIMYRDAVRPRTQPMREEPTKQPETHFIAKVPSPVREESRDKSPDTDAASSITMSDRESSQKGDDDMGDMKTETVDDNFEGGEVVYQNLGKGEAAVDELLVERSGSGRGSSGDSDHANVDSTKGNILDKAASPIPVTSPEVEHLAFVKAQIKKIEKRNHELDGTDGSNDISPKAETDGQQSPDIVREMAKDSPQIEETTVKTDTSKMILADDINKQDNDSDMTDNKTGSKFAENGIEDENGKTDTTDTKSPTVDIQKHDTHNAIDDKSDIISEHAFEPHIAETIETHTVLQATSDTNESQSTESVKELSTVTNGKESEIGVTTDSKIEPQIDLHVSTIQTEAKSEQHVTDDSKDSQSKDPVVVAHISEAGDNRQEHIDEHVAKSPVLEKTIEAKRDQSVSSDVVGKNEKDIASEHTDLQNDSSGHTNVKNESSDSQDHETYIKTQSQTTAIKGENQNEIVLKTESKTENISKEPISDKFNETNTEKATFDINESQSNETVTKLEDQSMEVKGGQHNETEFKQENKTEHMSKTDTESETQSTKTTSDVMDSQGNETKVKHQYQDIELHPHNETDHSHKIETEQISEFQVIDKQNESKMDKSVLDPKDSDVKETVSIINVEDDRNKKIASQNDALTEHISESSVSKFFINTANESDDNVTESSATLIKLPTDEMRAHVETDKHKSEENSLPHSSHDGDGTGGIPDGIKLEDNASHVAQEKVQSPSETIQHIIEDNQPEESTYPSHKPDIKTTLHDETNSASASTVTEQAKSPIAETYAEKREQRDINQQSSNVIRADVHASDIQHETDIYELEKKQNFESPVIDTRDDPAHQNETTFENGDTKAHRTEIKQVKYDTPDKETVHNETEHPVSKDADIEQVVEKTEDKVLETKVESEIIEQPNTDEDTAEVEASPTKERPDDIKGILTDNEGQLSAQPSNTSTNETVTADTTRSTCVDNANTIDNKGQSTHADSHSISGGSMHKDYPVVITNGNSGESSTNEEPTTASNVESNLQLKNDRAGSLKSKDNSPIEQSHQTLRLEPKGVEGVQHVVQTDKANVIEQRTKGKLNEADSQVIEQSQETAENKTDRTISSPDKINAIELTESNGSVEPKVVETTSKEDQIASENGALLNGHADTILENADTNLDAVDDDAGKVTTDKQAIVQEPTTNGIYDPSEDTVRGGKEQTAGEVKENGLPNTDGDDSQVSMKMMRGEVSAKTTYQRTSTGPIAISEVSPEGKYIMLENTSSGPNRRDVNLDGWKVKRIVDGKRDYLYPFRNFTLKSGKKVKILARGSASEAGLNDLVFRDEDNWGVGAQVNTSLINEKEDEKASHIQKTLYN